MVKKTVIVILGNLRAIVLVLIRKLELLLRLPSTTAITLSAYLLVE